MTETVSIVVIALLVINLLGLLMVGWRIGSQSADVRGLTADNRTLADRLTHLEARVNTMPTHRDLIELREDLSEVVENVAGIDGKADAMTLMLKSIQDHLLERN